jgi:ribosome biogenesis ATPase
MVLSVCYSLSVQVYQVVRKIIDDQSDGVDRVRLTVPVIYARIRGSNSSLNRKPKKLLEDSLERVLEVMKSDLFGDEEEESVEGDYEGLEEPPVTVCKILAEKLGRTVY